jgi:hypothetical protein
MFTLSCLLWDQSQHFLNVSRSSTDYQEITKEAKMINLKRGLVLGARIEFNTIWKVLNICVFCEFKESYD